MTKPTVGAVICVYDDSGHLTETVRRIYDTMDVIYVLIGTTPWSCSDPHKDFLATYQTASQLFDPEQKITIVSRRWASEHEQRNYGKDLLFKSGIDWCMVVDDDEFYNFDQLSTFVATLDKTKDVLVHLVPMHVYWKSRDYVLPNSNTSFPVFVRTDPAKTVFSKARAVTVMGGNWESSEHAQLVIHHLSYVRTDDHILKKVTRFSHAEQFNREWFDERWLKWEYGQDASLGIGDSQAVKRLESPLIKPCGYVAGSRLEALLQDLNTTVDPSVTCGSDRKADFLLKLGKKTNKDFRIVLDSEIPEALAKLGTSPYVHLAKWGVLVIQIGGATCEPTSPT